MVSDMHRVFWQTLTLCRDILPHCHCRFIRISRQCVRISSVGASTYFHLRTNIDSFSKTQCFFPNTRCCLHFENQRILKEELNLSVSRMKLIVFRVFKQLSTLYQFRFFQLCWKDRVLSQMNPIHIFTQLLLQLGLGIDSIFTLLIKLLL